jgi:hypothetical protein
MSAGCEGGEAATRGALHASSPRFTLGVPARGDESDVAGALASLVQSAAAAGGAFEVVVAVNGPGERAAAALVSFVETAGLAPVGDGAWAAGASAAPSFRMLRVATRSKVAAWNAIRSAARAPLIVFADADVRVPSAAIGRLLAGLDAAPALALVGAREQASVVPQDSIVARVAALPYRFLFSNVPGRLYALRTAALAEPMPAHVLHEDAYLTVRLGRARFAKEPAALVYFRPPATWSEYVRDRVRNEIAKLQLAREFPHLLAAHGVSPYPWADLLRALRPAEYPLLALLVGTRVYAQARARRLVRAGFPTTWAGLPSTKRWAGGPAAGR